MCCLNRLINSRLIENGLDFNSRDNRLNQEPVDTTSKVEPWIIGLDSRLAASKNRQFSIQNSEQFPRKKAWYAELRV